MEGEIEDTNEIKCVKGSQRRSLVTSRSFLNQKNYDQSCPPVWPRVHGARDPNGKPLAKIVHQRCPTSHQHAWLPSSHSSSFQSRGLAWHIWDV